MLSMSNSQIISIHVFIQYSQSPLCRLQCMSFCDSSIPTRKNETSIIDALESLKRPLRDFQKNKNFFVNTYIVAGWSLLYIES